MPTYVISTPNCCQFSGGQLALNLLARNLRNLGEVAYVKSGNGTPPLYGVPTCPDDLDMQSAVVVYPEVTDGNPLGSNNVVRWLLNRPGVVGGDGQYGEQDLVFAFADYFIDRPVAGILTACDFNQGFWKNEGRVRSGTCFLIRKGKDKVIDQHYQGAVQIDNYKFTGGNLYLRDVFNASQLFVSYDHATVVSLQAVLCGCLSVVIPDGEHTVSQWRKMLPWFTYGVAYGWDDVPRAVHTMGFVPGHLEAMERLSIEQTKAFISKTKAWLNGR